MKNKKVPIKEIFYPLANDNTLEQLDINVAAAL